MRSPRRPRPLFLLPSLLLTALALAAGCAPLRHQPRPLDPEASAARLEARSLADPALRDYLAAQGQPREPWPRAAWDLPALTLAAVFHHPEIELARARARLAGAERHTSTTRPPWTLTLRPEYDSRSGGTPWGVGVLVGLPLDVGGKRRARTEQLARLEEAAVLEVAVATWRVRSRLRRHFADLHAAGDTRRALEAEQTERARLLTLVQRREAAGLASGADTASLRLRLAEGELALRRSVVRQEQALGALAEAAGVPLGQLRAVRLDFTAVAAAPPVPPAAALQRAALTHRIDLRRKLADYAAAEAALRLEVARQYPDVNLLPGFAWNDDEGIWSLATLALVPPGARTRALVREAELRREIEEKAFLALQGAVIADAQAAAARHAAAAAAHEAARRMEEEAAIRGRQVERQFERGHADRVELVQARLEAAVARRGALTALLELQQGLAAVEDALQRPLDNPDLLASVPVAAAVQTAPQSPVDDD